MGKGEIGAESDRVLVARERLGIAALLMTNVAELIMRVGECREFCKRELELCGGFVESARSGKRNAISYVASASGMRPASESALASSPYGRGLSGRFAMLSCQIEMAER